MKFKSFLNESLKTVAFWITPDGKVFGSLKAHIAMVLENPEKFGFTFDEIKEIYRTYGEKIGVEGKARENIIRQLVLKGFTRIRLYGNIGWTINVLMASSKKHFNKEYITDWAKKMLSTGINGFKEEDKKSIVTITDAGRYKKVLTIGELADGDLLSESTQRKSLIICESISEFNDFIED